MTFLEDLQAHKGGLVRIKSDLFWYGGRGWDGITGRVCLLMDTAAAEAVASAAASTAAPRAAVAHTAALLLVDGAPHWVWVAQADVELLS